MRTGLKGPDSSEYKSHQFGDRDFGEGVHSFVTQTVLEPTKVSGRGRRPERIKTYIIIQLFYGTVRGVARDGVLEKCEDEVLILTFLCSGDLDSNRTPHRRCLPCSTN